MADIIIIILTIFSFAYQLITLSEIIFYKNKCRKSELHMVTNLWFDYIPHLLFVYSLFFIIYSIKFSDTAVLLTVISLAIVFILNIEILIFNKKDITLISLPFVKEKYNSITIQEKRIIVENEKRKKLIYLSAAKIEKVAENT